MTTFSGPIKQKAAYGDPNINTFVVDADGTVDARGGLTLGGKIILARKVVAASVSAASSAATTTLAPRGFLEVIVSGIRYAIPFVGTK
jgi:hypothetical protein